MNIIIGRYGEIGGKEVHKYILDNNNGLKAEILTYGGIISKLIFHGTDIVLGMDCLEDYLDNDGYFGALIGRNSNRIEDAKFELNKKFYNLFPNDGKNNLHGGRVGFNAVIWEAEPVSGEEPALILTHRSPDGEEGFPGEVTVKVTYTLTKDNSLVIHYEGETDADTVLNMTNHTYFNLNGHASGKVTNHTLWLRSSFFTLNNSQCLPTGEIMSVKNTAFDFRTAEALGKRITSGTKQLEMFGGFDHNFAIEGSGYRLAAMLRSDASGITMEMYTDRPGVQVYTGNAIDDTRKRKDDAIYPIHGGICLETQSFPNGLKYSHFPNGFLKKGEKYDTITEYKFTKQS